MPYATRTESASKLREKHGRTATKGVQALLLLGACSVLVACSSTGEKVAGTSPRSARTPANQASPYIPGDVPFLDPSSTGDTALAHIGDVGAQTLAPNRCGLFLWARTTERKLVFFHELGTQTATMHLSGQPVELALTSVTGEISSGLFETSHFETSPYTASVKITVEQRDGLSGGAVVPRGTINLAQQDGWQLILSTAGIVGCQKAGSQQ